jgi:SAM-dependent methyltransferase
MTACRICGSTAVKHVGNVEYLKGYRYPVYDCDACGCRFTPHDPTVHDRLHRQPSLSYYQGYVALAERCAALFAAHDLDGLRRELSAEAKYRFVIEHLDRLPRMAKVLEVGCARGHLTAYAILKELDVLGLDVSAEAIDAARRLFGPHFDIVPPGQPVSHGAFDLIYHVGLIGCVADPVGLTQQLLSQLRPGGELLFNAPNRGALYLRGQLWFDSAPPPDVVTLFPEGFWKSRFGAAAQVTEAIDGVDADASLRIATQRRLGIGWQPPVAQPEETRASQWRQPSTGATRLAARAAAKAARVAGLGSVVTARPAEFGMFVRMVKAA